MTGAESGWFVVANVKRETSHGTGGADKQVGLKHFSPGAKVYLGVWTQGSVEVLGRHRGGARLVKLVVESRHLENFRIKQVFNPKVLDAWLGRFDEGSAKDMLRFAMHWPTGEPSAAPAPAGQPDK